MEISHGKKMPQTCPASRRKGKTGSARTAPETTNISASIAPTHRAKGAISVGFTPSSYVSRHNEVPDHIAASLAGKQPGDAAFRNIRLPHNGPKMSTDVHRF
ncbi:hypothetical protein [Bradyrhizobium sp. 170]|uniref:hypothetical protein n=1 Tax=Bradyrhizobium sp. 170 TaxID=2782641 RepID=UPI001FFE3EB8|nr:hypothetical protein [Bradyrhizobium sp. 170]UPK05270.1 hypothetical protein IVB05_06045 [Bradyrhizobium sp. 170]